MLVMKVIEDFICKGSVKKKIEFSNNEISNNGLNPGSQEEYWKIKINYVYLKEKNFVLYDLILELLRLPTPPPLLMEIYKAVFKLTSVYAGLGSFSKLPIPWVGGCVCVCVVHLFVVEYLATI